MDAVNELSCEFAATVLARMQTNKQMTPQEAVSLIRNFYDALHPLIEQSDRVNFGKYLPPDPDEVKEKSAAGNFH